MLSSAVYSAGSGGQCRLGRPVSTSQQEQLAPAIIESLSNKKILSLCAGWRHNVVIFEDRTAYGWGHNGENQFGELPKDIIPVGGTNIPVPIFQGLGNLTWVQCGEKHTAVLTDVGKVYIVGSTYGSKPIKMKSNLPIVYIACGVGTVYAINCKGHIFESKFSMGNGIEYVLPEPICDIAAGSSFSIAVSVNGTAYAKGSDPACGCGSVYPNDGYEPIKSLKGIKVARVFAHEMQSIVITRDNRVFVCGNTADGRIGIEESSPQKNINMFVEVEYLRGKNIIEASCGDSHCVFLSKDGKIYGSGANSDYRSFAREKKTLFSPVLYENDDVKFSYVRCGCYHTVAIADPNYSPVHPGLRFFGLLVNKVRIPKYISIDINNTKRAVDVSIGTISMYGVMPGSKIRAIKERQCYNVIGIDGDKYVVESDGIVKEFMRSEFDLIDTNESTNDANFMYFGLRYGERVRCIHSKEQKEGFVSVFKEGTVWFNFQKKLMRVKEIDIKAIFSTITPIVESFEDEKFIDDHSHLGIPNENFKSVLSIDGRKRNVILLKCSDGIEYPLDFVEDVGFVLINERRGGKVIGRIGSYYCVQDIFTRKYELVEIARTQVMRSNKIVFQGDIYKDEEMGFVQVINLIGESMVVLPESHLLLGKQAVLVDKDVGMEYYNSIVARLFGELCLQIDDSPVMQYYGVLDLPEQTNYYPGDVIFFDAQNDQTPKLIHRIVSFYQKNGFLTDSNLFFYLENHDPIVILRRICPCQRKIRIEGEGTLSVSIYLDDFKGLRFIPGNQLTIEDQIYVVLGTHEEYLYIRNVNDFSIRSFYSKNAVPTENPGEYKLGNSIITCKEATDYPYALIFKEEFPYAYVTSDEGISE